jgi:hypothetical protein
MEDEFNTPAEAGTEDVQPEQTDTAPEWDYFDPDEDTEEVAAPEVTEDDGTTETEDDPETIEAESEETPSDEEGEEAQEAKPADTFELPDGTKVDRDEMVKGYLRQSDYTRKATETAERRRALEAESTRIAGISEAFVDHLTKMIPAAPDQALALSDPNAYTRQKVQHDAAVAQVQQLLELGQQAKATTDTLSAEDRAAAMAEENQKLAMAFPETMNPEGRQKFYGEVINAAEQVGFSQEELGQVTDHRLFVMAHWAGEGMRAAKARSAAKEKAAKAPPVAPKKPSRPQGQIRNRDAMQKLSRSGSIRDAMQVDFD